MNSPHVPTLTVQAVTPAIGAVIDGVDLSHVNDAEFAAIHGALIQHHVIFLRGQRLSNDALLGFARRFGEPQAATESSFGKLKGFPEIDVLDYDATRPPYVTKEIGRAHV